MKRSSMIYVAGVWICALMAGMVHGAQKLEYVEFNSKARPHIDAWLDEQGLTSADLTKYLRLVQESHPASGIQLYLLMTPEMCQRREEAFAQSALRHA